MELTSTTFVDGDDLPAVCTCDGAAMSPDLAWRDLPQGTGSLALCCVDPDAPDGPFVHWTAWDIDPTTAGFPRGEVPAGIRQGRNSDGGTGYTPPCPPVGHGVHHYRFRLFALRQPLDLDHGAPAERFDAAVGDLVIDRAEIVGTFERRAGGDDR